VVGADVNTGMIGVARSLPAAQGASIEWMEHSASHLPFADGEFDRVLCAQTLQFVEDRPRTLAEMYRVNAVSEEARQAVVQEMSGKLATYETGAGVWLPYRTHLVQARK
jgi:ubiquinone/menaquinone biosynthesis C-methylase UbiE